MFNSLFSTRGLSLNRLRVLLEVDTHGSIVVAAEGNPVRQSQYSRQLRELETFFGCELTRRDGRYLRLTPRGKDLANIARENLISLQDFLAACENRTRSICVAAGESTIRWVVIPSLGGICNGLNGERISLENARSAEIIHLLNEARAQLGIMRRTRVPEHLASISIGALEYSLYIPKKLLSSTSVQKSTGLEELVRGIPFGSLESTRALAKEQQEGDTPPPVLQTDSLPSLCSAIKSGFCCGILPSRAAEELPLSDFACYRPAEVKAMTRELMLVWNRRFEAVRDNASSIINIFSQGFSHQLTNEA